MLQTTALRGVDDRREPPFRDAGPKDPHLHEPRSFAPDHADVGCEGAGFGPGSDDVGDTFHDDESLQNVAYEVNTFSNDGSGTATSDMDTPADRLRTTRIEAGFRHAADAARHYSWNATTYQAHESGMRGIKAKVAKKYAEAFGVNEAWLLTGKAERERHIRTVRIAGYIGAGAQLFPMTGDDSWAGLDEIDAPPGASAQSVAAIIRGDSNLPIYEDGEVLVWSERRYDIDAFLNRTKPLIVHLADGRVLLKVVVRGGKPRRYTLVSPNAPPIEDVEVECVSRIDWTKPHR